MTQPTDLAGVLPAKPTHTRAFRLRRFANWFPLGLTYATLYMGRYNFNVAKGTIGTAYHLSKTEIGIVATAGFWTYAVSVLFNGPLADRFGGRRAILFGTFGSAVLNLLIGLLFVRGQAGGLIASLSVLYAINMYFQSFGALSIVKVNAAWFHYRERGVLGGVFGSMISLGYWLAYGICGFILAHAPLWAVYVVPAAVMVVMFVVDFILVRNRPSDAGHPEIETGEGEGSHAAEEEAPVGFFDVAKKVIAHPVIRVLAVAEFCTGLVRQGLLLYFPEFLKEVHGVDGKSGIFQIASGGITIGGICGALICGVLSDYFFQSRRAPVAFIFYVGQVISVFLLGIAPTPLSAALLVPFSAMWIFGVHGMLSGTASMDFGGKKAAATAAGLLDGVQYVGAGLTGIGFGFMLDKFHWKVWTYSIIPFSIIGGLLMLRLWNARPGKSAH
jgi:OPA family glycerol-3-phosphate transporter-like MFS transporter